MSEGIKSLAKDLQSMGRGKDKILAHIMPEEAELLKARGGRGSINPKTGLLEFGVDGGPDAGSTGSATGNSYGGSTSSGGSSLSGFGGGSSPSGVSGGGFSSNSGGGNTYSSSGGGGWTSSGGGGSIYSGGSSGGSFGLTGATGSAPMTIGGTGEGLAGSNPSFGLTGGVSYTSGNSGNTGWSSQYGSVPSSPAYAVAVPQSTFGVPTIVANAMQTIGNFFSTTVPQMATEAYNYMSAPAEPVADRFNVQAQTVQQPGFGEGISQAEVDKALAAGIDAGNFSASNLYGLGISGDAAGSQYASAGSVPVAPTGDMAGYSYSPPSDGSYIGSTTNTEVSDIAAGFPSWMSSNEPLFNQAQFDQEMSAFRDQMRTTFNDPIFSPDFSGVGAEADRAPTDVSAAPSFSISPSSVVMGEGMDFGNQMVGNPLYANVVTTPPTYSVDVNNMISLAKSYEKAPFGISFADPRTIYNGAVPMLGAYGASFTPDTGGVDMSQDTSFVPETGIASIPNYSYYAPENQSFFEHFSPALTPVSEGSYDTAWGSRYFDMPGGSSVSVDVAPQTFASLYGDTGDQGQVPSVLGSLNDTFNQLTGTPSQYAQLAPGQVPLYGAAEQFSGPKGALPMTQEARWAGGALFSNLEGLYGLPSGYLGRTYGVESSYGKDIGTPDKAYGPFQFMRGTGEAYGLIADGVDQRADLIQSADAAARLAADNAADLRAALGREPTAGELYLAHQQGSEVAAALLTNPTEPAINIISRFYRTPEMAMSALVGNGGNLTMTAGEFAQNWSDKLSRFASNPSGEQPVQYATDIRPTTPTKYRSIAEVPSEEVARDPMLVSDILERDFQASFGGGSKSSFGGRTTTGTVPPSPFAPAPEAPAPEAPTPTTGINLTRQVYTPNTFVATTSPAYS